MLVPRILPPMVARIKHKPRRALRTPAKSRSLVNCNQLATSDSKSMQKESLHAELERKNEKRKHRARQLALHATLCNTLSVIAVREYGLDSLRYSPEGLEGAYALPDRETGPWDAAKDYRRLKNCHTEFVGYKPQCCGSAAIAIPMNCNHRLCPLCNAGRLEQYRSKTREMLESMKNPTFLTLTIPNVPTLDKWTFRRIRAQWKVFRQSVDLMEIGGVYSIEVTYSRTRRDWHPHLHILFDCPYKLSLSPTKFRLLKKRLEWAWLVATDRSTVKRFPVPKPWRIKPDGKRSHMATLAERKERRFIEWNTATTEHPKGDPWNVVNRRVVDIRPVEDGDGAVYEVIKYMSKTNRFLDIPEAVEAYLRAVRGVRVIQPFGSCYRFKFPEDVDPKTYMQCDCGQHDFLRVGVFGLANVYQSETGCWYLKRQHQQQQQCRGGPI